MERCYSRTRTERISDSPAKRFPAFAAPVGAGIALLLIGMSPDVLAQGAIEYAQLPARAIHKIDASSLRTAHKTGRLTVPLPGVGGSARALVLSEKLHFGVTTLRAQEGDTRILVSTNGADAFGFVERGGERYVVDTVGGTVVVAEAARLSTGLEGIPPSDLYDDVVIDPAQIERARRALTLSKAEAPLLQAAAVGPTVVDIAVFYEQSLEQRTGFAGIRTQAQSMVEYTNEAFRASAIPLSLRLVYVGPYPDAVPVDPMRGEDAVRALGTRYGADIWHLLFDSELHRPGYGGKAGLVGYWGVTGGVGYYSAATTFRHEIGHNFGAHHDRANVFGNTSLPIASYNFAHRCSTAGTAMHYWTDGMMSLRDHYSDPSLSFQGSSCGVAFDQPNAAHNAKAIDVVRGMIADFRNPQPVYGNVAFVGGGAQVVEGERLLTIRLRRDGDLFQEGSVEVYTVDESTERGADYEPVAQRVQFQPGQSQAEIQLRVFDDSLREQAETLKLVLASPNFLEVEQGEFLVTINPDLELYNSTEELNEFSPTGVLRWGEIAGEDAYEVWVYRDAALTQLVEFSNALTARNYQFTRLTAGETYYVKIYFRSGGTWLDRDVFKLRTAANVVKPRVLNPQEEVEAFADEGMLRWSAVSGAESYEVWVYADPALSVLVHTSGPIRETQYRLSGLAAGGTVYVRIFSRVRGVFHAGDAMPVEVATRSDRARVLNSQEELDAFATDGILRWTAVTDASAYELWIFTNPSSSEIYESSGSLTTRAYQTRTLRPNTVYFVQVYAKVDGRWQVGSPFQIRTAPTVTTARLTNLQEELEAFPARGVLRWNEVPGADAYELWVYTNPGLGGIADSHAAGSARSYSPVSLCAGGTYYALVFAQVNGNWLTGWPTRLTLADGPATAGCRPPVPAASIRVNNANPAPNAQVELTWDARFADSCLLSHTIDGQPGWFSDTPVGFPQTWGSAFGTGTHVFSLRCSGRGGHTVAQTFFMVSGN